MAEPTPSELEALTIENLAYDLRRLDRERRRRPTKDDSPKWRAAVLRAYDERLRLASRALGIDQHLAESDGGDQDVERIRVESELHAAGLSFRGVEPEQIVQSVRSLVGGVVLILPSEHRDRYREEFRSELYELGTSGASWWRQFWYALRLFDRAWVLAAELREASLRRARS